MIYILEFEKEIGSGRYGRARYYVGYCADGQLDRRLDEHRAGRGAAITRWLKQNGIGFQVVMTLPGAGREVERQIKRYKCTRRWMRARMRASDGLQTTYR